MEKSQPKFKTIAIVVRVKLWSIDWELVNHYKDYDHLKFSAELQLVSG